MENYVAQFSEIKVISLQHQGWIMGGPCKLEDTISREDPLEKRMAIHSSIIAWRISWTEEPGRLRSRESPRVGHDFHFHLRYPKGDVQWSVKRKDLELETKSRTDELGQKWLVKI